MNNTMTQPLLWKKLENDYPELEDFERGDKRDSFLYKSDVQTAVNESLDDAEKEALNLIGKQHDSTHVEWEIVQIYRKRFGCVNSVPHPSPSDEGSGRSG